MVSTSVYRLAMFEMESEDEAYRRSMLTFDPSLTVFAVWLVDIVPPAA